MITRRGLLKGFAAVGAAGILVPELLIPERKYFLPPRGGWPGRPRYAYYKCTRLTDRYHNGSVAVYEPVGEPAELFSGTTLRGITVEGDLRARFPLAIHWWPGRPKPKELGDVIRVMAAGEGFEIINC